MAKKVTLIKEIIDSEECYCYTFDAHDGNEVKSFTVFDETVDVALIEEIGKYSKLGYKINYIDNPTKGQLLRKKIKNKLNRTTKDLAVKIMKSMDKD